VNDLIRFKKFLAIIELIKKGWIEGPPKDKIERYRNSISLEKLRKSTLILTVTTYKKCLMKNVHD